MALSLARASSDLYSLVTQLVASPELAGLGLNVERRGEIIAVLTPEGEIVIVPCNGLKMKFRWRGLGNIINRLLELYGELENKVSNNTASREETEAYDLLIRLLRHLLPSGEILITPELRDVLTRLGMLLPHLPNGEKYAPYIVAIGSALSRYRPIIELVYQTGETYNAPARGQVPLWALV